MMYSNKFVATIKNNGKVLREHGDTVYLPFGCEYSVLLKNLNSVRADVKISIDGVDVLNGSSLVVNPNSDIEIERFLKDLDKGNRFKFIERTDSVEQHRGVGAADGLVRIEYRFEKPYVPQVRPGWIYDDSPWKTTYGGGYSTTGVSRSLHNVGGALRGVDYSKGEAVKAVAMNAVNSYCADNGIVAQSAIHDGMATMDCSFNDAGITVPGSESHQKFRTVSSFPLEAQTHVIVLQLKGETEYNKVTKPVTVKSKPKCVTCGKLNKANAKFCSNCGTALEII